MKFLKNVIIINPVLDLGLQLQAVSNTSKKIPCRDVLEKILPNMIIYPCSELFKIFDKYHEVEVKIRCDKTYFTDTKKFVSHLKRFRQGCPYHAAVLDIVSFLYPVELDVAISKNPNLSKNRVNRVFRFNKKEGLTTEREKINKK